MSNRLFIGLLAVSLAASLSEACHPTGNVGTGTAGNGSQGTGNSSGAAGSGSAGTTGAAGTSGSAGTPGSAGSVSTTAGTSGSAGGTGNAGGTGTGNVGATGSAGTTGAGGAVTTADMIDHMDDGDARIIMANGRQGPWHSFSEPAGGNIQPPIGTGFLPATGGVNSTSHAVHVTGSNYSFGGVGFDLNNSTTTPESMQSQPYNASAYNGITFWAKGSGTLRIEFPQRSFVPTDRGGSCTGTCWNVYGATTPTLTGTWQQITISWSGMQREQGGTSPAFTANELMGVAFKAAPASTSGSTRSRSRVPAAPAPPAPRAAAARRAPRARPAARAAAARRAPRVRAARRARPARRVRPARAVPTTNRCRPRSRAAA